jgi:hypothetical protein
MDPQLTTVEQQIAAALARAIVREIVEEDGRLSPGKTEPARSVSR